MRLRTIQSLQDIARACEEITQIAAQHKGERRLVALAVERLLLIVGEAMTRIREDEPLVFEKIPSGAEIIGMRNVMLHGYDSIDWDRIQDAVRDDLPVLLSHVQQLLGE